MDSLTVTDVSQAIVLANERYTMESENKLQIRKSRWSQEARQPTQRGHRLGPESEKPYRPLPFIDLPVGLGANEIDRFLREQRLEDLRRKMVMNEIEDVDPDIRSASPPPVYDRLGNRTNTREIRIKNSMVAEYNRLIRYMIKNVEGYQPPTDWKPQKLVKKIIIPNDRYPDILFLGIIVGPRGTNHKEMQEKSGCRIVIRGQGITDKWQTDEEAAMPQHIHIEADSEEQIQIAEDLIVPLLNPNSSEFAAQKQRGAEQVAVFNGLKSLVPRDLLEPDIPSYVTLDARVQNEVMQRDKEVMENVRKNTKEEELRQHQMSQHYADLMNEVNQT